ncbi:MAG: hypothetical protein COT14_02650 [Candidatus Diapherotrites archaeon CG08_land_8_20_14_0_20_30_16]|nr:MAG: hypothetical protein COT14_02650 [Candidatus Diapherotrites archaeon CG08_land_8_20_14_0_20_30_16]
MIFMITENLCNGCDLCCRKYKIYLFPNEAKAIARNLHLNYREFVNQYLDYYFELFPYQPNMKTDFLGIVLDKKRYFLFLCLALKQKSNHCVFLKNKQCAIYNSRPLICRLFPEFKFYGEKFDFCKLDKQARNADDPRIFYPLFTKYIKEIKHNRLENVWKYLPEYTENNSCLIINGKKQKLSAEFLRILRPNL